jgi:hypothetical protein
MDFERFRNQNLATLFMETYLRHCQSMFLPADTAIFNYFKCLRANVRAKVHAFRAMQLGNGREKGLETEHVRTYLGLLMRYIRENDRL